VASPPYDVLSREDAARIIAANPLSFLRVTRPDGELPADTPPAADAVYQRAAANYARLRREVPLTADPVPSLYLYRLQAGAHAQTGVVAAFSVDDYENNVIRKHETTRRDKEDDRTRHILALRSQTGPVFLIHRPHAGIDRAMAEVGATPPMFEFRADDGVRHTAWRVPAPVADRLVRAFAEDIPRVYIADGHHRAASACRTRAACRDANPGHTGRESYNRFVGVVFSADQLRILPYNRVVRFPPSVTAESLLDACRRRFTLSPVDAATPDRPGVIHMFTAGRWWRMEYTGDRAALAPVDRLDVSVLQSLVLAPLLGIADPRTSPQIDFVGGIHGPDELVRRVTAGRADAAFSLHPVTVDQLMAIADADAIMPPKSTWFEPKLRDGLFVHDI
jgi:uncharacterized protein (DUF1015 family)